VSGQTVKFGVHERHQLVHRRLVPIAPGQQ
jgi:hypothetical protein